jgi:hypothetical protein
MVKSIAWLTPPQVFVKLRGARALFEHFVTPVVAKRAQLLGKIDNPPS